MRTVSIRLEDLEKMTIKIGFVGENEHTRVCIDCKKAFEEYPNAAAALTVQPPAGEAYPDVTMRDGDTVIWDVMDHDLTDEGEGEFQLSFVVDETVMKSYIGRLAVCRSIVPAGDVPEAIDDWLTRANAALAEIPIEIAAALEEAKESGEFDGRGISDAVLNSDYTLTLYFTDGTSYTTPSIRGEKGKDFTIAKTFSSIEQMEAYTGTDIEAGDYVMINTGDTEDADNGKLFCYMPGVNILNTSTMTADVRPNKNYIFSATLTVTSGTNQYISFWHTATQGIGTITEIAYYRNVGSTFNESINITTEQYDIKLRVTFTRLSAENVSITEKWGYICDLSGPQGEQGIQGEEGEPGVSPTASVTKSGNTATITITDKTGTTTAQVTDGATGETGATPIITIGTVSTLEPGSDATASMDTTDPEHPVLSLGIPEGEPGEVTEAELQAEASARTSADADLKSALDHTNEVIGDPKYDIGNPLTLTTENGWWNATTGAWASNNSYQSAKIAVEPGEYYAVTAAVYKSVNFALAVFLDSSNNLVGSYKKSDASETVLYYDEIVPIPDGTSYMCITTIKASLSNIVVKEAELIPLSDYAESTQTELEGIFDHKNLINPEEIELLLRYSSNLDKIVSDLTNYCGTGLIPVEEGEMYTFSGTAMQSIGGYFGADARMVENQAAIADISFFDPVTGSGKVFTVPTGQNIKYVSLVMKKANGAVDGTYQLEKGEMATEIVPYSTVTIKKTLLPSGSTEPLTDFDSLPKPQYNSEYIAPIAKFRDHWAKKDKDLMVVGTGTSLTARGAEHCTSREDASSRPPLMDSNNFASAMWDLMRWEGQKYRRYDYTGFFTESGTFLTSRNLSDWDDANYHDAWTRYSNGACSVAYTIPADAWQANFIYRTDQSGSETVTVAVAEGNGVMQVWNGTAWVEANGYTFSMRETPVILPSVSVPNPRGNEDNSNFTLNNYQVSGNTTYQKRLKMRAVTRTATKAITISSTSGRFMYWGVEWSVREFMITYVNSARGSHNMTVDSATALQKYQDNEIWSHKPDLIFCENPIHNSGGSGSNNGFVSYYSTYWRNVTYDFFFNTETNPVSLMSRAIACGIDVTNLEWCIFNSSISWNFGGIDDDGLLKIQPDKNGRMITALDAQMMSQDYLTDTEKCVSINACKYWVDAAFKMFGNLKAATVGSGKDGSTFTNEGSHWNDTGCKIIARCVGGVFDFYN